jgi:chromosome segregation ATPase
MISADVQRIELEARKRSLDDYKLKCQELRVENDRLLEDNEKQEHDSQLVLKFLRDDAERKDELIESLKKTINQQRELFAAQREDERRASAEELASVRAELTAQGNDLEAKLADALDELARLQEFKEQKENMERALEQGESEREAMKEDHKLALEGLERKFLEEKNRLQKVRAAPRSPCSGGPGVAGFTSIELATVHVWSACGGSPAPLCRPVRALLCGAA